ncbi:MAG: YIEGIA domain-containing protein [Bacillota bacterium]
MLRSDYRQYPTYPHGYSTHLFMGIFAALAGAVADSCAPGARVDGRHLLPVWWPSSSGA